MAVSVDRLYEAFLDEALRALAARGRPARSHGVEAEVGPLRPGDGDTRVNVTAIAKGEAKSTAEFRHERLADAREAERMKAFWRGRVAALKDVLER